MQRETHRSGAPGALRWSVGLCRSAHQTTSLQTLARHTAERVSTDQPTRVTNSLWWPPWIAIRAQCLCDIFTRSAHRVHTSLRGGEADLEAARQREAELAAALSEARAEAEAAQQTAEDRLDRLRRQAADSEDRCALNPTSSGHYNSRTAGRVTDDNAEVSSTVVDPSPQ